MAPASHTLPTRPYQPKLTTKNNTHCPFTLPCLLPLLPVESDNAVMLFWAVVVFYIPSPHCAMLAHFASATTTHCLFSSGPVLQLLSFCSFCAWQFRHYCGGPDVAMECVHESTSRNQQGVWRLRLAQHGNTSRACVHGCRRSGTRQVGFQFFQLTVTNVKF